MNKRSTFQITTESSSALVQFCLCHLVLFLALRDLIYKCCLRKWALFCRWKLWDTEARDPPDAIQPPIGGVRILNPGSLATACHAAVHGVTKSRAQLSDWTEYGSRPNLLNNALFCLLNYYAQSFDQVIVVLEKTLESPLDCKEIKPVSPKGN